MEWGISTIGLSFGTQTQTSNGLIPFLIQAEHKVWEEEQQQVQHDATIFWEMQAQLYTLQPFNYRQPW